MKLNHKHITNMRKVLIKQWIPVEYCKEDGKRNQRMPGTGCLSDNFDTEATFESWGISYDTQNDCNGNISVMQFTVAIVILSDGTLEEVTPSNMKFVVDEKQQKLKAAAPELLEVLQNIVDYWNTPQQGTTSMNDHINHIFNLADNAIKKATE